MQKLKSYKFDYLFIYFLIAKLNSDSKLSPTPDHDVFKHLALTYSLNHQVMHKGKTILFYINWIESLFIQKKNTGPKCDGVQRFTNGITNGAEWYILEGGMQDYNYVYGGCMELTLGKKFNSIVYYQYRILI